ncbi:HTH-type transcriptional regulator DmlR [Paraburkholderia domus]|jgi:DNA-binding transcriptional LysR family regulator|uniref:LysR family transcriptional regulator n=1 Tax=Paraburkholderia domus TaxID=2793075 RepID=UPI001912EECF|nr:LysR family transcriptional regulator [Paraburkholderia domus]MBK5060159.1 LysR family transcriptional regulator [Burkholderia sp. R-70199]MBK5085209.1 LysR family transcriptional regulator [Burkholderia sp. R-69927]MBK5179702.1 LysR family transcriptional regulator [Burkholderia sp. R-69749]CAE6772503.1 HTH-type transcriptional regulator DmlR [Paraburkholderia domus]CAE6825578.1 HTH-type transcriptional regulator DmlR [Paraburkholderia domus]
MDLTSLADFNAVALHGGFGPASRALDRPKATLSRRVAELEEDLGVRLIERGARRLRLTEEGLALHERTRGLMTEIQEAGEAVASRAPVPRGRLRISAPVVFAHVALCQIAARFALAYPQVELEVIAEDRVADPVEDGYDLVIRIDPPHDEQLVGRRILGDERLVVASPTMSIPSTPASEAGELEVPAVMSVAASSGVLWNMRTEGGGVSVIKPMPVLRMSSLLMVREAVLQGVGVALLPRLLVEQDVQTGRLVCWGAEAGSPVEIWALYSSRRLLSAKVRAFMDMLKPDSVRV